MLNFEQGGRLAGKIDCLTPLIGHQSAVDVTFNTSVSESRARLNLLAFFLKDELCRQFKIPKSWILRPIQSMRYCEVSFTSTWGCLTHWTLRYKETKPTKLVLMTQKIVNGIDLRSLKLNTLT